MSGTLEKRSRGINKLDLYGRFIKHYGSAQIAAFMIGGEAVYIRWSAGNRKCTAHGFLWEWDSVGVPE